MTLEKFKKADEALYRQLVFNVQAMEMNLGRIFTEEEAEAFFQAMLEINASGSCTGFYKVFVPQEEDVSYIGMGAITINEEYGTAELEYMLLPQFWNQGYGTELVSTLLRMTKDSGLFSRVIAITDPANQYSRRILRKNGFELSERLANDDGEPVELYSKQI